MRSTSKLALMVLLVAMQAASGIATPAPQKPTEKQDQNKQKVASMTGCVDQQEGQYILIDDHSRNRIADLQADGFPTEGFAKHVGHKVTVRGMSIAGSAQPLFRVRSIETVSDVCAPQRP